MVTRSLSVSLDADQKAQLYSIYFQCRLNGASTEQLSPLLDVACSPPVDTVFLTEEPPSGRFTD